MASWTISAIWSLLCWNLIKVWTLSLNEWKKVSEQSSDRHINRLREHYEADAKAEAREKAKEQDGARNDDGESIKSATRGEKNNKKAKPKTVEERIDGTRRKEHKEKDDRIRDHVKFLTHPPETYGRTETNALRSRKKNQQGVQGDTSSSRLSRKVSPTDLFLGENGAVSAIGNHSLKPRSVRYLFIWQAREKKRRRKVGLKNEKINRLP